MKVKYLPLLALITFSCGEESNETKTITKSTESDSVKVNSNTTVEEPQKLYCMVDNLNVRPNAGIKGEVIYQLGEGEVVFPTGKQSDETFKATFRGTEYDKPWIEVKTNFGLSGWVHSGALLEEEPLPDEKYTASYYSTPERRKAWWKSLDSKWQRVFNIMALNKPDNTNQPNDEELQKLFSLTDLTLGPDGGCGDYNYEFEVDDLSGIRNLTNLEAIDISYIVTKDLTQLSHLKKLTSLHAEGCELESLAGIGSLKNLKHLSVSYNEIKSLKPLIALTNINTIFISENKIENLDGVSNLTNLKELYMSGNPIINFSGISQLTSLVSLDIERSKISNLDIVNELIKCKNFNNLSIKSCENITDITALKKLKGLERINLGYMKLKDLSPIEHVKTLMKNYEYNEDDPFIPQEEIKRIEKLGIEVYAQEEVCGC